MKKPEQTQFDWDARAGRAGENPEPGYWDNFLTQRYGDKALFTFEEVCAILGCVRNSVRRLVGGGVLDVRRMCSSPRITRESLIKYLESQPKKTQNNNLS